MSDTIKRYWSAANPMNCTAEHARAFDSFDAKLSKEDVIEMQKIDADCNDCRHFQRGKMNKYPGLVTFSGVCGKTGASTTAYPTQFSGRDCFEHRRE